MKQDFSSYPVGDVGRGCHVFVPDDGGPVALSFTEGSGSVSFLSVAAHLTPEQARAIAADLVRAADFSEGKVAP